MTSGQLFDARREAHVPPIEPQEDHPEEYIDYMALLQYKILSSMSRRGEENETRS